MIPLTSIKYVKEAMRLEKKVSYIAFNSKNKKTQASRKEIPSATGPAYKIPCKPNKYPKVSMDGMRNRICRDKDKIALLILFPIAWKKIPDGI